jgi:hypothetical protein
MNINIFYCKGLFLSVVGLYTSFYFFTLGFYATFKMYYEIKEQPQLNLAYWAKNSLIVFLKGQKCLN